MTSTTTSGEDQERVTIVSRDFTPAAMEFHRRRMGEQGYAIEGPIVKKRLFHIEGPAAPEPVLGGEEFFAVTFVRPREAVAAA